MSDEEEQVLLATTDFIPGREVSDHLGLVVGALKLGMGGTSKIEDISASSTGRLSAAAQQLGADAVIGLRFSTVSAQGSDHNSGIFCYGTAVKLK